MKRNLNILLVGFISLILMFSACEKDKLKDISEETQNGLQLLYEEGEMMSVTPDVILPEGSSLSVEDVKVSSMVSDDAEVVFSEIPTLVLGEDVNGNTLLLAYAIPKTVSSEAKTGSLKTALSNLELSIKSSAVALVMMRIGAVDPQSRTQLVEEIVKHSAFPALVEEMENQFVQKPSFLDEVMNHETIVAAVRTISQDVLDAYLIELQASSKSAVQRLKSANTKSLKLSGAIDNFWRWSPWNNEEPWYWYGEANALDVTLPPFLAKSLKGDIDDEKKRFAIGNPTNINYIADIYEADTDKFLDYRYVGRNSTFIQKTVNSYAAQTPILTDVNFDEFEDDKVYKISIKKCLTQDIDKYYHWGCLGSHVFHVAESALNIVADGDPLGVVAEVFTSKHSVQIIVGAAEASLSSVNVGDFESASNIASLLETCVTILADEGVKLLIKDKIKGSSQKIIKKSVTKLTAKLTNPAGWALMAFEAANDFVPLSVSLVSAPAKVDYYVNWSNGTVSEEYTPLSLKLTSPDDLAKVNESAVNLSWESTGNSFDVYWGTEEPLVEIASGITTKQFVKEDLTAGQTYFWKIIAHDDFGIDIESEVRSFSLEDNKGAPELLAFYPLTTDAKDYSGNGNDGTPYGGLSFGSNGASFDGVDDYIDLDKKIGDLESFTVSANYYLSSLSSGQNMIYEDNNCRFRVDKDSFYILVWNNRNGSGSFTQLNGYTPKLDVFTSLQLVVDNYTYKIYENGVEQTYITTTTSDFSRNSTNANIGRSADANSYYKGKINNVAIFNSALSDSQITELYNNEGVPDGVTLPNPDNGDVNLTNGLVAYYPFNGNVNDESGNGNDGVVDGASLTQDRKGNTNSAYSFDGVDDYIEIPHSDEFNLTDFTLVAWCRISEIGEHGARLIHKWNNNSSWNTHNYGLGLSSNGYSIVGFKNLQPSVQGFGAEGNTNNNDDNWHQIIGCVKGGEFIKIYVDGVLENSEEITAVPEYANSPIRIGKTEDSINWYGCPKGDIDNIRIYNRVLNEAEIETLYKQ